VTAAQLGGGRVQRKGEDKGLFGSLLSIPVSAAKAIGAGVAAVPQFVGKTAQTAYGFGEGLVDLSLDLIDEDIFKSRFETDLERGRELGLEGDALVAYAGQRQYPLGSMIIQSGAATGRRVGELATAGAYDTGEEGIDYAKAFRQGDLGALLVEDVGNVILAGRAGGLGNVVARAGAAVPGRTGRVISTTGRLIEEPVATTTRGVARATGAGAQRATGRLAPLGAIVDPAERISQAERPLRQIVNEIRDIYQERREGQLAELDTEIANLIEQRDAADIMGDTARREAIQEDINKKQQEQGRALEGTGVVKYARRIVKRWTIASERDRQTLIAQFARVTDRGAAPEKVATYRSRAERLRREAEAATDAVTRERKTAEAVANETMANLKEQFPEEFDKPLDPTTQEAAIHYGTRKAIVLYELAKRGYTTEQLVRAATDPTITPYLAERGLQPTAEGVLKAIEYVKAQRGEQSTLNAAQIFSLDSVYSLMKRWNDFMTTAMGRGEGMPQGPAPFYWFQTFPVPHYLLPLIDALKNERQLAILSQLDNAAVMLMDSLVRSGLTDIFETLKIDPENPQGAWRKLVKDGLAELEIKEKQGQSLAYRIAFGALQLSYRRLRELEPDLMLNPEIYPATMRPMIITLRQAVRGVTGEDVRMMADQLMTLARDYGDIIPGRTLDAIARDIGIAVDPQRRITKDAWRRLRNRIVQVQETATARSRELGNKAAELTAQQQNELAALNAIAEQLGGVMMAVDQIVEAGPQPTTRLIRARGRLKEAEARQAELATEQAAVGAEIDAAAQAQIAGQTDLQAETTRLRSDYDTRQTKVNELQDELDAAESGLADLGGALDRLDRLAAEGIDNLAIFEDLATATDVARSTRERRSSVRDWEVKAAKRADEAMRQEEVDTAFAAVEEILGGGKLLRDITPDDPRYGDKWKFEFVDKEDYVSIIEGALASYPDRDAIVEAFLETHTEYNGTKTVDRIAEDAANREWNNTDPERTLAEVVRRFALQYKAEEALRKTKRRTLKSYREELRAGVDAAVDDAVSEATRTGLTLTQLNQLLELLDPEKRAVAVNLRNATQRRIETLRQQIADERRALAGMRRDLADAEGALLVRTPGELTRRRQQVRAEQKKVTTQIPRLRQSVGFAERAEPAGAIAQERGALRRIVDIRRPAPGAEGPTLVRMQPRLVRRATASMEKLNAKQEQTVKRLKVLKGRIAEQDALASAADIANEIITGEVRRPSLVGPEMPLGPEMLRPGEEPLYLPAGPRRSVLPSRDVTLQIRGEGAAPQTRLQATQQRYSGAFELTVNGLIGRMNEVLGQMYRNSAVEELIADPTVAQSAGTLLTPDRYAQIVADAERAVAEQGIARDQNEFPAAVKRQVGTVVLREVDKAGYEVVSPVKMDPDRQGHEPVGDLQRTVSPDAVDENSIVMRKGMAERLFSEFERKYARQLPVPVDRVLNGLGELTSRWKSHILPISLRWQIGDAVGILMFAWIRGDIPPRQLAARIREVVGRMTDPNDPRLGTILFTDLLGQPLTDPVLAAGFGAALQARGIKAEETRFIELQAARLTGEQVAVGRFKRYDQFRNKAFRLNEAINSIGRAAVYIENLDRILTEKGRSLDEVNGPNTLNDPEITAAIREAVDAANNTLGAFSDLSPWEKQVLRKVFPFWSWIKFINKAAFELAIDQPDRVLFYAHLGSIAADPDGNDLSDWLRGKTPFLGALYDLNFLNPYQDAFVFKGNPLTASAETFTSISPAYTVPLTAANELYFAQTGRFLPIGSRLSRPGYLEGRPEATTRGMGDVLGGIGYTALTGLGGPLRNVLQLLPEGTVPFTDVATGPVQRFQQGSLRTTGAYAEPRLGPITGRLAALGRTFGIPAPLIEQDMAKKQAEEQAQRDQAARLRRIKERQRAGQ
jgi:hypothetical protein